MEIRRARLDDARALAELNADTQAMHGAAYPERFRRDAPRDEVEAALRESIGSPACYWIVAEEGGPIGFLNAEFRDREANWCVAAHRVCYVAGLVVAEGFRRRGIGRALVEALSRESEGRGAAWMELDVWAFNGAAREAFARMGFGGVMERMVRSVQRSQG